MVLVPMRKRLARRHPGPHLPFASTVPADNPAAISGSQSPSPLPTSSSGLRGTRPVPVEKSLPITGTSGNPSANARFAICDASDLSACAGCGGWPGPLPQPSGGVLGGRNLGTARRGRHHPINCRGVRLNVLRGSHDPALIKYTGSPRNDRAWVSSSPSPPEGRRPYAPLWDPWPRGALLRPDPAGGASSSLGSASVQPPVTKRAV